MRIGQGFLVAKSATDYRVELNDNVLISSS